MKIIGAKLAEIDGEHVVFLCPGCKRHHMVRIAGSGHPLWSYNANPDAPSFSPSVLWRGINYKGGDAELDRILDTYNLPADREKMLADQRIDMICHSFVRDGKIQFLGDCTHELAGQTVDLPEIDIDESK